MTGVDLNHGSTQETTLRASREERAPLHWVHVKFGGDQSTRAYVPTLQLQCDGGAYKLLYRDTR